MLWASIFALVCPSWHVITNVFCSSSSARSSVQISLVLSDLLKSVVGLRQLRSCASGPFRCLTSLNSCGNDNPPTQTVFYLNQGPRHTAKVHPQEAPFQISLVGRFSIRTSTDIYRSLMRALKKKDIYACHHTYISSDLHSYIFCSS